MMKSPASFEETLAALRGTLVQLSRWGCRGFDSSEQALASVAQWLRPQTGRAQGPPVATVAEPDSLVSIQAELVECRRCDLSKGRTHLVFGEGNASAELIFVGEGPGFEEDQRARPFVGPAGHLLTRIIESMKLTREQVYICNVVKCRPPDNRNPAPEEIAACRLFLERQIAAIQPKAICALGLIAAQTLLASTLPISRLRGRFYDYRGIPVMATYHPAYLLRNPDQKRVVWEDIKKIMAILDIQL